jgi:hypothetical protein
MNRIKNVNHFGRFMRKRIIYIMVFVIIMIGCFIGCDEATKPAPPLVSVEVSPYQVSLARGSTQQFSATINGTDTPLRGVSWTVQGAQTGSSINSNGVLTVLSGETAITLTVRATSTSDNNIFGTATVTLSGAIVTDVSINPSSVNVSRGATQDFTATVTGYHNPPQTVLWTLTGSSNANTTINSNGRLSVAENETATALTITATSTFDNTKSNMANVTVSAPPVIFNVSNVSEWSEAVNSIRAGGNNRVYTINVTGEISLPVGTGSTFGSVISLQVTLQGGGTLSKSADGRLIGIGGSQTIIARNITLDGANRTSAVVNVEGGMFRMEDGSIVRNNNCTGVWVSGGTLIMIGGSIVENTSNQWNLGGGVTLINSASFVMHGNAIISNNIGGGAFSGGGIYIGNGSNFTMEGGSIIGNTSEDYTVNGDGGGGIYNEGGFIMNNGEISHNRALGLSGWGGGVYVRSGTVVMNGGMIQQNSSTGWGGGVFINDYSTFNMNGGSILNNNAGSDGGGVSIGGGWWGSGTFNMNGGLISHNQAVRNGGGVNGRASSTFTKTSGTISNNTAIARGNTAFSAGSPDRWRNANAGPTINTRDYGFWLND